MNKTIKFLVREETNKDIRLDKFITNKFQNLRDLKLKKLYYLEALK